MFFRVLAVLCLALAGCAEKSTEPSVNRTNDAASVASGQAPLGSETSTSPGKQQDPAAGQQTRDAVNPVPGAQAGGPPTQPATGSGPATVSPSSTATSTSSTPTTTPASAPDSTFSQTSTPPTTLPTSSTSTVAPPPAAPAQATGACTVALVGVQGILPAPATRGGCSPAPFVSPTGAAFTSIAVQVTQGATVLPAAALVQVKDASGNVIGSAAGLGPLQIAVPSAWVPSTPSVPLTTEVSLTGLFTSYSATMTFTLS